MLIEVISSKDPKRKLTATISEELLVDLAEKHAVDAREELTKVLQAYVDNEENVH